MTLSVGLAGPEATWTVGHALGASLEGGDVVALVGELGAGKTTLARGVAAGAGASDDAQSPTFALINEYRGARVTLAHADLYRIERARELDEIGWDELLDRRDVAALVEWADRFPDRLPADHVVVTLAYAGDGRTLVAEARGPRGEQVLARWAARLRVLGPSEP